MLTQKRRGPAPTGKGQIVGVRLHDDLLGPLDRYVIDQAGDLGRPEAIRRLLRNELSRLGYLRVGAPDEGKRPDELDATNDD